MKKVLIPTDFKIESLAQLRFAMQQFGEEKLEIIFFHIMSPQDSISDLLFASRRREHLSLITPAFQDACQILKNRFSERISGLRVEFVTGTTATYLNNFLEDAGADVVLCPEKYVFAQPHARSLDPLPLIRKANRTVMQVPMEAAAPEVYNLPLAALMMQAS